MTQHDYNVAFLALGVLLLVVIVGVRVLEVVLEWWDDRKKP